MAARLDVVGTGIDPWRDTSEYTKHRIATADDVLYLVADPMATRWVTALNDGAESLAHLYASHIDPIDAYDAIVATTMERLRRGHTVCLVLYGHPGVFAMPGHNAIALARAEGFEATMHPAVSAADCLYADLGVDPGKHGCLSVEASHFLERRPHFDTSLALVLWQIGVVGASTPATYTQPPGLAELVDFLSERYGSDHGVTVYEAATQPTFHPRIETVRLAELTEVPLTQASTLYVPPLISESVAPTS